MNDLELLTTKKGMTFGKAWMLIFFMILSLLFAGMVVGFISRMFDIDPAMFSPVLMISGLFTLTTLVSIIWGYFINLKEWPYFRKQSLQVVLLCVLSAFLSRFLASVFEEIPILIFNTGATKKLMNEHLVNLLSLLGVLTLQIGVIAHGLFRNYAFQRVVVTVVVLAIVQMEPRAIVSLAAISLLLLIVYYRTGGFHLVLMVIGIYIGSEYFLSLFYGFDATARNNYRNVVIGNDPLYFSLLTAATLALVWALRRIARLSQPIQWRRAVEYPVF